MSCFPQSLGSYFHGFLAGFDLCSRIICHLEVIVCWLDGLGSKIKSGTLCVKLDVRQISHCAQKVRGQGAIRRSNVHGQGKGRIWWLRAPIVWISVNKKQLTNFWEKPLCSSLLSYCQLHSKQTIWILSTLNRLIRDALPDSIIMNVWNCPPCFVQLSAESVVGNVTICLKSADHFKTKSQPNRNHGFSTAVLVHLALLLRIETEYRPMQRPDIRISPVGKSQAIDVPIGRKDRWGLTAGPSRRPIKVVNEP